MEEKEITFKEKCLIMIVPCFIVWVCMFGISLLLNHDKWWINALITLFITLLAGYSITTMDGDEDNDDMMP